MATSAVAYKESFGFDAPPYTYADFEAFSRKKDTCAATRGSSCIELFGGREGGKIGGVVEFPIFARDGHASEHAAVTGT